MIVCYIGDYRHNAAVPAPKSFRCARCLSFPFAAVMTLAQQPAFASNEYVTRWLTTVEEMAENAHQQQSLFVSEGEDSASSPRRKHRNTFTGM